MGKRKTLHILIFLLLFLVISEFVIILLQRNRTKEQKETETISDVTIKDLRYGDSFYTIPVLDAEGKEAVLKCGEHNTVLFYLSPSCASCGDALRFAGRLQRVFGEDNLQVLLLWSDSMPVSLIEEYGIAPENCFSINGSIAINAPTPTAYLLDSQGSIIYYNADIKLCIEKLYMQVVEEGLEKQLRLNANRYLVEHFGISDFEKQQIVYFCMDGCPDCAAADDILANDEGKDERNLYYLYTYNDTEPSHERDEYALLKLVYGIEWYPSFLILQSEEEYRIVGEVPVETLLQELDSYKEEK